MSSGRRIVIEFLGKDKSVGTTAKGIEHNLGGMSSKMAMFGKRAALGLAGATAAGVVFLAKVGGPYVDSLNKIQVLTGANEKVMSRVSTALEKQSGQYAKMGLTTGDAAAGVVELVKAGMSLDSAMKAVYSTMVLAKAGEMSVADASTLVSNTLNTFGLKAKDAGDVANYLANAANISSANVADLAEAFKYVAPVAAASGVKVQQVNALLAELSNKGIQASVAGTGLRNMFLSLQSPSGAGGKAIKALGVEVFTAQGKARPFADVLDDLGSKLKGVSDQTRKADLKAIFGKTGINAAQVLLEGGVKGLQTYTKGVMRAGAAQRLAAANSKGLRGTLMMLKAEFVSLGQSIYREFSPVVDKVLRPLAVSFGDMSAKALPAIHKFIDQGTGKLGKALSGLGSSKMGGELKKTLGALGDFGKQMLPTLRQLGDQLMKTLGPGLKQLGDVISGQFLPAFRKILPVIAPVAKFLLKMFGSALIGVIGGAIKVLKGLLTVISGVFNLIADLIHGDWSKIWGDLGQIMSGALTLVVGILQVWWNAGILAVFKRGALFLTKGIWKKLWTDLKGLATRGMELLRTSAERGLQALGRVIAGAVKGYLGLWKRYLSFLRSIVVNGLKVLRSAFGGALSAIRSVISDFGSGAVRLFKAAWSAIKGGVSAAWGAIKGAVRSGVSAMLGIIRSIPGKVLSAIGDLSKTLFNAGVALISGLISGIGSKIGAVKDKLTGLTHSMTSWKGPLDKDKKLLTPAGVAIMDGLIAGITKRRMAVKKVLGDVTDYVKRQNDKLKTLLSNKRDLASQFQGFTSSVFQQDMGDSGQPTTAKSLIAYQAQQAAKASTLKGDVSKLIKMGLSKDLIKQLASSGESGIAQIHALASGTASDVHQLNQLNASTNASLSSLGSLAGGAVFGDSIAQTRRDKATAQAIAKELREILDHHDRDTKVMLVIDGKVMQTSLLKLKKKNKKPLGLS